MQSKTNIHLKDFDFMFENSMVKVIANRNSPEIIIAELKIGPFEEGNEYELRFWIAQELEKARIVRFRQEELLDMQQLHKIHWKERVQGISRMSTLPENFYPKLRRYLNRLRENALKNPDKMQEYMKANQLARDIINNRVKKIVSLASIPTPTNQFIKNLTAEELALFEQLHQIISSWRDKILEGGKKG
jgi:hypothetical protein